jgi:tetrahydromethanopterin S-methyltransferase subunit B
MPDDEVINLKFEYLREKMESIDKKLEKLVDSISTRQEDLEVRLVALEVSDAQNKIFRKVVYGILAGAAGLVGLAVLFALTGIGG